MTKSHTYGKLWQTKFSSYNSDQKGSEKNILDQEYGDQPGLLFDKAFGLVILVNQTFCKFTGYKEEDVVGHHLSMIFPDLIINGKNFGDIFTQEIVMADQRCKIIKVIVLKITSDNKTVLLKILPLTDELKNEYDVNKSKFDQVIQLAELSKANSLNLALQQSVPILRGLFNAKLVNIYWLDDDGMVYRRNFGFDPNNLMPRQLPLSDMMMLSRSMVWRNNLNSEAKIDKVDSLLQLNYFVSIPLGVRHGVVGLILIGYKITAPPKGVEKLMEFVRVNFNATISHFNLNENILSEVKNRDQKIRLQDYLINNLKEGLFILAPDLSIQKVNSACEIMFGYSESEILLKPIEDVIIGPSILLSSFLDAQKGIPTHNLGNLQIHHRSGYPFSVKIQILPIMDGQKVENIVVLISDVSEYEQITLRTQQLENRAILGEFISAFAHDIRNPINNISTSLQLLTRKMPEDDPSQEIVDRLTEDCERLTQLMESFLSYSRLVDNSRFKPIDVASLLNHIVSKWKPTMDNFGIQTHISIAEDLPKIHADRRSLERVFINLLSNAIDAMKEEVDNPVLGVIITENENQDLRKKQIRISISDNGIGIPEDMKQRIFEPFVSTKSDGTGLGLAISKQIITAHKGTIIVESFPGGTVFNVLLPVTEN